MADPAINVYVSREQTSDFNKKVHELFHKTRADYDECLLRYNVLTLMNDIWQSYLIEQEENAMINKSNTKYSSIITNETQVEIETIGTTKNKPYKKYIGSSNTEKANDKDTPTNNVWYTPIEAPQKVIIIRERENGAIIKKVIIPSVMIFGSIAFGLDGIGSDIDLAVPAGIYNQSVNAHLDGSRQINLLREFHARLQLNTSKSNKLGFKWRIEPIFHARVPIIKLQDMHHGLAVDISVRSTQTPITKLINYYCSYNEKVSLFYMFIKQWSKVRKISDAMHGFPNSFGFVMLVTKFLQLLAEPVLPIMDYDRNKKKVIEKHSVRKFKPNTQTLLELAVSFFDYYFNFDFESYQISITSAGLQWKHSDDYNVNHSDQSTMLIEDPSSKRENVTRCLKPYNLKILKQEFFRGYKCAKNGDWDLLFKPYNEKHEESIFDTYPATDEIEEEIRYEFEEYDGYGQYHNEEIQQQQHQNQNQNQYHDNVYQKQQKQYYKTNKYKKAKNNKNNKKYIKKKQNFYQNNQ